MRYLVAGAVAVAVLVSRPKRGGPGSGGSVAGAINSATLIQEAQAAALSGESPQNALSTGQGSRSSEEDATNLMARGTANQAAIANSSLATTSKYAGTDTAKHLKQIAASAALVYQEVPNETNAQLAIQAANAYNAYLAGVPS